MTPPPAPDAALLDPLEQVPEKSLVGVSGGLDSVALLHALVATGKRPTVLHFNHRWRDDADEDAALVRRLAQGYGLDCRVGRARKSATATKSEAAAREARYAFFRREAQRSQRRSLVLAHHADDQVETFLLQLLRGSGTGRGGMRALSERAGLILLRPWLGVWRQEALAYAKRHRLAWRDDASNADLRYRRNWVRGRLLPYLEKNTGPGVAGALWRAAEIGAAENAWLDGLCHPFARREQLAVRELAAMPLAQVRRVLRLWLEQRGVADLSFGQVEAARGLLSSTRPAKINLAQGRHLRRRAGRLFVESPR